MFLNKKHATRRVQVGKSAVIADRSMMTTEERAVSDAVDEANGLESGDKAFDDETDLKNEDFVFVYWKQIDILPGQETFTKLERET